MKEIMLSAKCGFVEVRELANMVDMSRLSKNFWNIRMIQGFNIMSLVKQTVMGIWMSINLKELK